MATEPTIKQVFGNNATVTTLNGQQGIFISFADIDSATQSTLPTSPNGEEIFAGIISTAGQFLTTTARDNNPYVSDPSGTNQNIGIIFPSVDDLPDVVARDGNIVLRKVVQIQLDGPLENATKIVPKDY
jgi:hypothetical protein